MGERGTDSSMGNHGCCERRARWGRRTALRRRNRGQPLVRGVSRVSWTWLREVCCGACSWLGSQPFLGGLGRAPSAGGKRSLICGGEAFGCLIRRYGTIRLRRNLHGFPASDRYGNRRRSASLSGCKGRPECSICAPHARVDASPQTARYVPLWAVATRRRSVTRRATGVTRCPLGGVRSCAEPRRSRRPRR